MVPLADGLEEIEAVTPIDIFRRADLEVVTCYLGDDSEVRGSKEIIFKAEKSIKDISAGELKGIVLPGGMPGADNLRRNKILLNLINSVNNAGGLLAANCAAPIVLEKAGILKGKKATSYPGFEAQMPSCNYKEKRVVKDGNIITARGPGVALEFSFKILEEFIPVAEVNNLKEKMMVREY